LDPRIRQLRSTTFGGERLTRRQIAAEPAVADQLKVLRDRLMKHLADTGAHAPWASLRLGTTTPTTAVRSTRAGQSIRRRPDRERRHSGKHTGRSGIADKPG